VLKKSFASLTGLNSREALGFRSVLRSVLVVCAEEPVKPLALSGQGE
jgi:hypothetical protein